MAGIKTPYFELVFPADFHSYPLLFEEVTKYSKYNQEYNQLIKNFIEEEKQSGGPDHKLIASHELNNYSTTDYKYVILHEMIFDESFRTNSYGNTMTQNNELSFYFFDRQNGTRYRIYGKTDIVVGRQDPKYPDIQPKKIEKFFKILKRIDKGLEKKGSDRTFKKELRRQKWITHPPQVIMWMGIAGLPVGLIVVGAITGG